MKDRNPQTGRMARSALGWTMVTAATLLFATGGLTSCNTHVAQFNKSEGTLQGRLKTSVSNQVAMDLLWVIDNSGSMCQEQKVLRDNFDTFIDEIKDTSLDFHIAVTTTHAPGDDVRGLIEPVAREGYIQSVPQPVPGPNAVCLANFNAAGDVIDFQPFRDALEGALDCLSDAGTRGQYNWTDNQIACALSGRPNCAADVGGVDANGDSVYDSFDLFPSPSAYRSIPKVIKAGDYRNADGSLNVDRLKNDFACMSLVGTRGYGLEKGLQAAVEAVSVPLTGGAVDNAGAAVLMSADTAAPNHGFIRQDAGFALIFVTDENDCSHNGELKEFGNACGGNVCDYENTSQSGGLLTPVEVLADGLKANLAATKGREITENELLVASIHGNWDRFEDPKPDCAAGDKPAINPVCASAVGEAYSGDRYERFIRQFQNFFPNAATEQAKAANPSFDPSTDFSVKLFGWICAGDFTPALQAIGEFLAGINPSCVTDAVYPCETDADCPAQVFSGAAGTCSPYPSDPSRNFCDTGIILKIERDATKDAIFSEIADNPYCLAGSVNQLRTTRPSCVVDPARYQWSGCAATTGLTFNWSEPEATVAQQLAGYDLELVYNAAIVERSSQ